MQRLDGHTRPNQSKIEIAGGDKVDRVSNRDSDVIAARADSDGQAALVRVGSRLDIPGAQIRRLFRGTIGCADRLPIKTAVSCALADSSSAMSQPEAYRLVVVLL